MRATVFAASVVLGVVALVAACGGSTVSIPSDGGGGGGAAVDAAASDDGAERDSDASACVLVDLASYDLSCAQDSDCTTITTGSLCAGGCACGNASINAAGVARYQAQISGVKLEACPCEFPGPARCAQGTCILCTLGPAGPSGCSDAG